MITAGDCDGSQAEQFARGLPGEAESNKDQYVRGSSAHDGWTGAGQKKSQRESQPQFWCLMTQQNPVFSFFVFIFNFTIMALCFYGWDIFKCFCPLSKRKKNYPPQPTVAWPCYYSLSAERFVTCTAHYQSIMTA